jgi:hypothetical protein
MSDRPNLAPADELADVREQRKALETREATLRAILIGDPSSRTGNHYVAELREVEKSHLDIKAMREMYPDMVAEHMYPRKETQIHLKAISEDGEILPIRRTKGAMA